MRGLPIARNKGRHQDEQHGLGGPGVEQDAFVNAGPGHRRDRPEPEAEHDERERAAASPLPAAPSHPPDGHEVPGGDHQDQHQHRHVDPPLGERPGEGQLGGATRKRSQTRACLKTTPRRSRADASGLALRPVRDTVHGHGSSRGQLSPNRSRNYHSWPHHFEPRSRRRLPCSTR